MPCPSPPLSLPRLPYLLRPRSSSPLFPSQRPGSLAAIAAPRRLLGRDYCTPYAACLALGPVPSVDPPMSLQCTPSHQHTFLCRPRARPPLPLSQQLRLLRHVTPCALCTQAALPVYQHAPSTVHREPPCHPPHTHTPSCLGHCTSPRGRWGPTCAPARCLACQCPSSEQRCSTLPARVVP